VQIWVFRDVAKMRGNVASRAGDLGGNGSPREMQTRAQLSAAGATELIARIWHGQTLATMADDYARYLDEKGVRAIARIPGNRGVQMLCTVRDGIADFLVLSYWDSFEAIKLFAGDDYEQVRHLPDDPKYMIGDAPTVRHFEVIVNDGGKSQ
jgi:heme-degrading monooxygenase HmoA